MLLQHERNGNMCMNLNACLYSYDYRNRTYK